MPLWRPTLAAPAQCDCNAVASSQALSAAEAWDQALRGDPQTRLHSCLPELTQILCRNVVLQQKKLLLPWGAVTTKRILQRRAWDANASHRILMHDGKPRWTRSRSQRQLRQRAPEHRSHLPSQIAQLRRAHRSHHRVSQRRMRGSVSWRPAWPSSRKTSAACWPRRSTSEWPCRRAHHADHPVKAQQMLMVGLRVRLLSGI